MSCAAIVSALAGMDDAKPEILPRGAWGAQPADETTMRKQNAREIVIHHTAVRQQPKVSLERKLRGLQSFSQKTGTVNAKQKPAWGDVPYHFYIDVTGRIGEGRDVAFAGDTNTKYDTLDMIQIVVEGEFNMEEPAPAQLEMLRKLTGWLAAKYQIPPASIRAHDDHAQTSCPGKNLKSFLPALRKEAAASN